jgi:hypothetical protein
VVKRKLTKTIEGNAALAKPVTGVNALTWPKLCEAVLACEDVPTLNRWLKATVEGGQTLYRALRIHGRLNAVRRAQEIKAIHAAVGPKPIAAKEDAA